MRRLAILGMLLLLARPAAADMYPDASNAVLPWNLPTTNDAALNNGIGITSGYSGPILDNPGHFQWWGVQVKHGASTCEDQFFKMFRPISGFAAGIASCGAVPPGSTSHQYIPGLFSVEGLGGSGTAPIAVVAQGSVKGNAGTVMGLNTLKSDTQVTGDSTASSIAGTTLTVGGTIRGIFNVGDVVGGTNVTPNSFILQQLTGTAGGAGTYQLSRASTAGTTAIIAKAYQYGGTVQDEYDVFCIMNDTRCRHIIDGYFQNGEQASVEGVTVGGTVTAGDVLNLTITDTTIAGSPKTISYTALGGDTATTAATGLVAAINTDAALLAAGYFARAVGAQARVYFPTNYGALQRPAVTFGQSVTGTATLTLALVSSGNDQRYGVGVTLFSNSAGRWQNAFYSPSGAADFALVVGTWDTASVVGRRSQGTKWYYTDNTSAAAIRIATLYVDPALAGASGVDMVLGNNSGQATNLRLPNGGVTMTGNLVSTTLTGSNVHILGTTVANQNDTELWFQKARGGTSGPTLISANDNLGSIRFQGYDGSAYVNGASIIGTSQSVAAGNVGGVLQLLTNGTERLRVTDSGISLPTLTTTGTATGSLCIDSAGVVFKKTTTGPCL